MSGHKRTIAGFTLLEVMVALAVLVLGIVGLLGRVAGNIRTTQELTTRGIAVDLARGKMYDIEEKLLQEGFQELSQSEDGDFDDEGYPNIEWEAEIEKVEMPGLGAMQAIEEGQEAAAEGGLADSPLGGFMGGMGGGDGGDFGMAALAGWFEMVTQALEVSMRKVTLTVKWKVGRDEEKLIVAAYFTAPKKLEEVIPKLSPGGFGGGAGGGAGGRGGAGGGGLGGGRQPAGGGR